MSMTTTFRTHADRPRRRLVRIILLGIGAVAGVIGMYAAIFAYQDWRARQDWQDACAEADRLDARWRWDEP